MNAFHKRISIPHPTIVLHGAGIALACGLSAEMESDKPHGLFAGDTRVLSSFRMLVSGQSWTPLGWEREGSATATFNFQNPKLQGMRGAVPPGSLLLRLRRRVEGALHDHLSLRNFGCEARFLRLTFLIDADFSDIFEVHDGKPTPHLEVERFPHENGLYFFYERKDFQRGLFLEVSCRNGKPQYVGSSIVFDLDLKSQECWECCFDAIPEIEHQRSSFLGNPHEPEVDIGAEGQVSLSADHILQGPFDRSQKDLSALGVPQRKAPPYLAAGVPWFLTLFGRDSLLTALMTGINGTWAAEGALKALADRQATFRDDWRDAEPGKFPHEIRQGELAHFGVIPHSAYYAAHDAQELYCLALWHAWRWSGKRQLLDSYFDAALKALKWCDELGDRDGDGFLEYQTRSRKGYYNQSWKDSGDAIVDEKGTIASLPIATVELQGYYYAARLAMSELYLAMGDDEEAKRLLQKADRLKTLVEERFWMEENGFYAMALDGHKRQAKAISSNPGHLLWCGLVRPDRAAKVAERILAPDMFTGWGLRTLSSKNPAYNPISYQLGSVWPHDTILAASGLWRYGLYEQADRLIRAILEAATLFDQHRLPELFCGMDRAEGSPVPYVSANIPQAWAAAVPLLAAQLFLGIVPDAPRSRCFFQPRLPAWLDQLEMHDIRVGEETIDIRLVRQGERTGLEVIKNTGLQILLENPPAPLWGAPHPPDESRRRGKAA